MTARPTSPPPTTFTLLTVWAAAIASAPGLIYSLLTGKGPQDAINFAAAASCLKHTIEHDVNLVSIEEVDALVAGNSTGRVQR